MDNTTPAAAQDSGSSVKFNPLSNELCPVAKCCLISAKMLEIADNDVPDPARRLRLKKLNAGQARLLQEAARQAEDMAFNSDLMLQALKAAALWIETICDSQNIDPFTTVITVSAVSTEGKRALVNVSLADTQRDIGIAIAAATGAA